MPHICASSVTMTGSVVAGTSSWKRSTGSQTTISAWDSASAKTKGVSPRKSAAVLDGELCRTTVSTTWAVDDLPAENASLEGFRHRFFNRAVEADRHLPDVGFQHVCVARARMASFHPWTDCRKEGLVPRDYFQRPCRPGWSFNINDIALLKSPHRF